MKVEYNNLIHAFRLDEESLATIIANSSEKFINDNHLCVGVFQWQQSCSAFSEKQSYANEYEGYVKFYQQAIRKKTKE
jgi:hypothetical protein